MTPGMKKAAYLLGAILILSNLSACVALLAGGTVATASAVHDRRSVGTVIDDRTLTVSVRNALYGRDDFDGRHRIKVSVYAGWVLLIGEVGSAERVALATEVVSDLEGVQRLFNELSAEPRVSVWRASRDRSLSAQVNAHLTRIRDLPDFDASRVKVSSARGVVYLQGRVSEAEAQAAVETVRTVRGVERVVMLFDLQP